MGTFSLAGEYQKCFYVMELQSKYMAAVQGGVDHDVSQENSQWNSSK